ncbi:glycosyltransferase family 2 protein [Pantoea sp.]|uniref:glycosyltransferase family 2 protein n=1 Tax=Pantoea sp. TaxID=69393 RepID=UPI00289FFBC2|nr:glycosyltransferase family 2 protein [Pantoea sp.]
MITQGTVSILLGTYNGEKYIGRQLESIRSQTYKNWVLYISDDGSSDDTLKIAKEFAAEFPDGKVNLLDGPRKGFAQNFLSMLQNKDIHSEFYAFSDQDDVWLDDKLEASLNALYSKENENSYLLYGSRTTLIDENEKPIGFSPLFKRKFCLENALVQSYAGGNTMVMNHNVKDFIENIKVDFDIVSHDWFLYILCSALNGMIIYDSNSKILYRQHGGNLVGSNLGISSKLYRLKKIYSGEYKKWNELNLYFLDLIKKDVCNKNKRIIGLFYKKERFWFQRALNVVRSGIFRQKKYETLFFIIMAMLGKLN